jgi:large subunit ribosomal protein L23
MLKNKVKSIYVTEKSETIKGLKDLESNPCIKKFEASKYVFLVDKSANKGEIKREIEELYKDQKISIKKVNTIKIPNKKKRTKRGIGKTAVRKKAIITLAPGQEIEFNN